MVELKRFSDGMGKMMLLWQRIQRDIILAEGITPAGKKILYGLFRKPGITKSELAQIIVLKNSSVTRAMQRLELEGFVQRNIDNDDRRAVRLFLTDKGIEKTNKIRDRFIKIALEPTLPCVSKDKLIEFIDFLEMLVINTEAIVN